MFHFCRCLWLDISSVPLKADHFVFAQSFFSLTFVGFHSDLIPLSNLTLYYSFCVFFLSVLEYHFVIVLCFNDLFCFLFLRFGWYPVTERLPLRKSRVRAVSLHITDNSHLLRYASMRVPIKANTAIFGAQTKHPC